MGGGGEKKKREKTAAKRRLKIKGWEYLSRQRGWVPTSHTIPKSVLKNKKCKRQTIGLGTIKNSSWKLGMANFVFSPPLFSQPTTNLQIILYRSSKCKH